MLEFRQVTPTAEDCKGDPGFYFRIAAVDGNPASVGGVIAHFCSVTDKAQFNLGIICQEAGGIPTVAVEKLIADVKTQKQHEAVAKALDTKLKGKRFAANVADDNYDGKVKSVLVLNTIGDASVFAGAPAAAPKTPRTPRSVEPAAAEPATEPVEPGAQEPPAPAEDPATMEADFDRMLAEALK